MLLFHTELIGSSFLYELEEIDIAKGSLLCKTAPMDIIVFSVMTLKIRFSSYLRF
jgi:hypothetical protein